MRSMIFEHFSGKDLCGTEDEVRAVLGKTENGKNEFIIYTAPDQETGLDDGPPYIILLVKGEYAYIWYTHSEDMAGYQAYGEELGLDPDGSTIFYLTATEEMYVPNRYVATRERALQAVLGFMALDRWPACYEQLPKCVRWEEL